MNSVTFPIQPFVDYGKHGPDRKAVKDELTSIPWELIAAHEDQALRNHGQTIKRLAERHGLGASEAVAVLENRPWERMEPQAANDMLRDLVVNYYSTRA